MPIDFHMEKNRYAYATRQADPSWTQTITSIVDPQGKRVVDVGCGGGIYSQAWMQLGAASVVGVDFSAQMIEAARERLGGVANLTFQRGDASATGLEDGCADIVFARALLHHVTDLPACLAEAYRLLAPNGLYIIQDRTPEDVQLEGSREHLRGYFFAKFPRLLAVENSRRPRHEVIRATMQRAGFTVLATLTFWETRQIYPNVRALADDLRSRAGRSILHELSDAEMTELIDFVARHVPGNEPIVEKDRWTLWWGTRA